MKTYLLRRVLYFFPVWAGVYLLTFALFHIHDPLTLAAVQMPQAPPERLHAWIRNHGYHLPLFFNLPEDAVTVRVDGQTHPELADHGLFYSQFFLGLRRIVLFDLGVDRSKKLVVESLRERIWPTLSVMGPALLLSTLLSIVFALALASLRGTPLDRAGTVVSVTSMSVALPVYILAAFAVFGGWLLVVPVYGHIFLPILVAVLANLGAQVRFYRSVFLEELGRDYVRVARARGITNMGLLGRHILPASAVPILTQVALSIPYVITGSLLLEQFFGVPGMGDMLYGALARQDLPVIEALVYLGAFVYMLTALLVDVAYAVVDPRIVLK